MSYHGSYGGRGSHHDDLFYPNRHNRGNYHNYSSHSQPNPRHHSNRNNSNNAAPWKTHHAKQRNYEDDSKQESFRDTDGAIVTSEKLPFAEGALRYAYKGEYIRGPRRGQPVVVKKWKNKHVFSADFWKADLKCHQTAALLVDMWNKTGAISKKYVMSHPWEATCVTSCVGVQRSRIIEQKVSVGELVLIEDFIYGKFEKWNSNSGYIGDSRASVQAFCHWTYHYSKGKYVMCDAQGVRGENVYYITDPCILSDKEGQFGLTDLGAEYVINWMNRHKCNEFCNPRWRQAPNRETNTLPPSKHTTYVFQTKLKTGAYNQHTQNVHHHHQRMNNRNRLPDLYEY